MALRVLETRRDYEAQLTVTFCGCAVKSSKVAGQMVGARREASRLRFAFAQLGSRG